MVAPFTLGSTLSGCGGESVSVTSCNEGAIEEVVCEDGASHKLRTCQEGRWIDKSCQARSNFCTAGDVTTEVCGLNDQGARTFTCSISETWVSGDCADPDVCKNADTQEVTCQQFGLQEQVCDDGKWVDQGRCVLECQEGKRATRACGFNERGQQGVICAGGTWTGEGDCVDPDVCLDDEVNTLACTGGFGRREQACVFGQWTEGECFGHTLVGSTTASDLLSSLGFCGLDHAGQALCWGSNTQGQLGLGHKQTVEGIQRPQPTRTFQDIGYGAKHACGVTMDGDVYCWGANGSGQLGNGNTLPEVVPTQVAGISGMVGIALGDAHTCALHASGSVQCWGDNRHGQLGMDSTVNTRAPNPVLNLSNAAKLVAGGHTTCAIDTTNNLSCWGDNTHGQLGNTTKTDGKVPAGVVGMTNVISVDVSKRHACAVNDRQVYCWGSNKLGELGDDGTADRLKPVKSALTPKGRAVAVGDLMSCAVAEDGGVFCWGHNFNGELGRSTFSNSDVRNPLPERIQNFTENVAITIANSQAVMPMNTVCAFKKDGALFCWGAGVSGSIPNPSAGTRNMYPLAIPAP